jgi:hypothetical protein
MTNNSDSPLVHEPWISLSQAARLFPPARSNRPISASCVWRWFRKGVRTPDGRRVHLETLRVVNRFVTSEAAARRFVLAQQSGAEARSPEESPLSAPRTPVQRSRASTHAAAELAARGL